MKVGHSIFLAPASSSNSSVAFAGTTRDQATSLLHVVSDDRARRLGNNPREEFVSSWTCVCFPADVTCMHSSNRGDTTHGIDRRVTTTIDRERCRENLQLSTLLGIGLDLDDGH